MANYIPQHLHIMYINTLDAYFVEKEKDATQ